MLTPLQAEDWDDRTKDAQVSKQARHPDLEAKFLPLSAYLTTSSTLPARLRELVILRVAHHHGCHREWQHHRPIGTAAGLSDADVEAARTGVAADPFDRVVLAAVDEMHQGSQISPVTWAALGERLDERARIDLIFTAGGYGVLATALNTLEPGPH